MQYENDEYRIHGSLKHSSVQALECWRCKMPRAPTLQAQLEAADGSHEEVVAALGAALKSAQAQQQGGDTQVKPSINHQCNQRVDILF